MGIVLDKSKSLLLGSYGLKKVVLAITQSFFGFEKKDILVTPIK